MPARPPRSTARRQATETRIASRRVCGRIVSQLTGTKFERLPFERIVVNSSDGFVCQKSRGTFVKVSPRGGSHVRLIASNVSGVVRGTKYVSAFCLHSFARFVPANFLSDFTRLRANSSENLNVNTRVTTGEERRKSVKLDSTCNVQQFIIFNLSSATFSSRVRLV